MRTPRALVGLALLATAWVTGASAQAPQTAQLSGRVVAADTGAPLRSSSIRLVSMKPEGGTVIAISDDEGRFELSGVIAAQYSIQVSKPGFVSGTYGLSPDAPGPFSVTAGQKISLGDIRLPRAGAIAGRVVDTYGDVVAEAAITAWRVEFQTPRSRRVVSVRSFQSNDLGEFRLYGLAPGKYYVSAALKPGPLPDAPTFYPGTANVGEAEPVEVKAGQDTFGLTLPLTVAPYGVVTGVVTDSRGAPYTGAVAWLVPARTDGVSVNTVQLTGAAADVDGRFRIINVSPGDYRVEIFSRAYLEKIGTTGTVGIGSEPAGEVASVPVSVGAGRTEEVAVQATAGFTIRGRMFLDGAPLPGKQGVSVATMPAISVISAAGIPSTAEVGPDGSFVMTGVMGPRLLSGRAPGAFVHRVLVGGVDVTETGLDVTADVNGAELHLTTRPARVEGTVLDPAGAPVPGARPWVLVFSTRRDEWLTPGSRRYQSLRASNEGTFQLSIPAGSYLAAVVPAEDRYRWADPDYLESLRPVATPFAATDGSTTKVTLTVKR